MSYNEYENAMNEMQSALTEERNKSNQLAMANAANSMFSSSVDPNLIEWQLELDNILERIDHLLRGHTLEQDTEGNYKWRKPTDKSLEILNEYGVQAILRILSIYLNRNTILSNYTVDEVRIKMEDFSTEIVDSLFLQYDEMGLNTPDKRKLYFVICRAIIDTVHSAFNRAIQGGERESLRTARTVTQSEPMARNQNPMMQHTSPDRGRSIFRPSSWIG